MPNKILLAIFLLHFLAGGAYAKQDWVYAITVNHNHSLSGFKAKGIKGIITALHGVAGYHDITIAQYKSSRIFTRDISIIKIDRQNDVCILSSPEINSIPVESGIPIDSNYSVNELPRFELNVDGYPFGLLGEKSIGVKMDKAYPVKPLQDCLKASDAKSLNKSKSPDPEIVVFDLNGPIRPGHSGAPLIYNGAVIGIIDGGLIGDGLDYSWAVILKKVHFEPLKKEENYKLLNQVNYLFSYEYSPDANLQPGNGTDQTRRTIAEVIRVVDDSLSKLIGKPYPTKQVGELKRYISTVNYFNALKSIVTTRATFNNVIMGSLECTLDHENMEPSENPGPSNESVPLVSDAYKKIKNDYLNVKATIHLCLKERIAYSGEEITNKENGEMMDVMILKDSDMAIIVGLFKHTGWNLTLRFINKWSIQKDIIYQQFHPK
jgi:hypothetical protein